MHKFYQLWGQGKKRSRGDTVHYLPGRVVLADNFWFGVKTAFQFYFIFNGYFLVEKFAYSRFVLAKELNTQ